MKELQKVENSLGKLFESAPKIPESGRESVAKAMPVIALVFGILQLVGAYSVWRLSRVVEALDSLARAISVNYNQNYGISAFDKTLIYIGVLVLVVDAVILLMAYDPLSKRKKKGWDLLFLGALLNVAYGVLSVFINGRGVGSLIVSLIGSGLGMWLLFQIRGKYSGVNEKVEKVEKVASAAVKEVKKTVKKAAKK
jgi:predicted neutral ceramidase superfamily lipid hydrolase